MVRVFLYGVFRAGKTGEYLKPTMQLMPVSIRDFGVDPPPPPPAVLLMAYLHCQIPVRTANQMATLQYAKHFTGHGVGFKFSSQLPSTGMGSESISEFASVNVNKP